MFSFQSKIVHLSNNIIGNVIQCTKSYATAKKLPIKWMPPIKIPSIDPRQSGDGGLDLDIKPTDYVKLFEKSKELET